MPLAGLLHREPGSGVLRVPPRTLRSGTRRSPAWRAARSGSRRCGRCRSASRARGRAWRAAVVRGRRRCGCRRSSRSPTPPAAAAARVKTRPGCWARYLSSSNSLKVRSRTRPPSLAVYVASSIDDVAGADLVGVGVVGVALGAQPADREPQPGLDLGRAGRVEQDVVHAPVGGDGGEAALGDDEHQRARRCRWCGSAGTGRGPAARSRRPSTSRTSASGASTQRAALGRQHADLVRQQARARAAPPSRAAVRSSATAPDSSGRLLHRWV